jgi:hypothetical protein
MTGELVDVGFAGDMSSKVDGSSMVDRSVGSDGSVADGLVTDGLVGRQVSGSSAAFRRYEV